jgi:hypothetical protein
MLNERSAACGLATDREEGMIKRVYRVLAYLIAAGVVLQAAAIAFAVFGMFEWVSAGGIIDKALIESDNPQIGGIAGFNLHHLVGVTMLPLLALLFLISSFFARIPGGIKWGLIIFAATLAQSLLGIYSHEVSAVGWLHGAMALILFSCATASGIRVNRALANRTRASIQLEPAGKAQWTDPKGAWPPDVSQIEWLGGHRPQVRARGCGLA